MHRSGLIALIGEANAGKSTLLNSILGRKISIVSPKPHTTRNRILGIKRLPDAECVFVDTPGFPRSGSKSRVVRSELARQLQRTLKEATTEVDSVVLVIDAAKIAKEETGPERLRRYAVGLRASLQDRSVGLPDVIALNKVDLVRKDHLLPLIAVLAEVFATAADSANRLEIIPLSALRLDGVDALLDVLQKRLPEGPPLFPADVDTDQSERFFVSEIVREKLFINLREELPHSVAVQVEDWKDEGTRLYIGCLILIERDAHKPIVLGKGGQMIRKIGEAARLELETRFETDVVLKLFVRVEENWSRTAQGLQRAGMQ